MSRLKNSPEVARYKRWRPVARSVAEGASFVWRITGWYWVWRVRTGAYAFASRLFDDAHSYYRREEWRFKTEKES